MLGRAAMAVATVTPLTYLAASVHADGGKDDLPRKVKISQLPIYGEPETPQLEFIPQKETYFREQVSFARQKIWSVMDETQDTIDSVKQKYETGKAHTSDLLHYIQEDSGIIARATIITVAGLGGIVAGYRGGVLKKAIYSATSMTGAGAVCYPQQAVDISKSCWDQVSSQAWALWEDKKPVKMEANEVKEEVLEATEPQESVNVDESNMDHGMSKAEDKDMYTTRSG